MARQPSTSLASRREGPSLKSALHVSLIFEPNPRQLPIRLSKRRKATARAANHKLSQPPYPKSKETRWKPRNPRSNRLLRSRRSLQISYDRSESKLRRITRPRLTRPWRSWSSINKTLTLLPSNESHGQNRNARLRWQLRTKRSVRRTHVWRNSRQRLPATGRSRALWPMPRRDTHSSSKKRTVK